MISGRITDQLQRSGIKNVNIRVTGMYYFCTSDSAGRFRMMLPSNRSYQLVFSHVAYQTLSRQLKVGTDPVNLEIVLQQKNNLLDSIAVNARQLPETLVGKPNYSIFDFDFYEEKLLLLTAERSLSRSKVMLSDYHGKVFSAFEVPKQAGAAKYLFHDYEGYTELVCEDSVFRLDVLHKALMVVPIPRSEFKHYLVPVCDSLNNNYYYSNAWDQYPGFNYYFTSKQDTASHLLRNITNERLMDLYNFEYYFLPPHLQLEARRVEQYHHLDHHIAAAIMSGFTKSMFYEPLYAPLIIVNDTICIFNHYNDHMYHYGRDNQLIDSVAISYHHPKNWRDWKKKLLLDETENRIYALFAKDGHYYIKQLDHQTGREKLTFKLLHHSAEKIKIRDGFAYYVYRPFGSTQEKFLYRERIDQ